MGLCFNRFNFSLSYRPGSQNTKPDALSRLYDSEPAAKEPEHILPLNGVVGGVTWQIESEVKSANGVSPAPSGCPQDRLLVPVSTGYPLGSHIGAHLSSRDKKNCVFH